MKSVTDGFSNAFLIATILLALAVISGLHANPAILLTVLVTSVIFLGLPHGALDPLVAQSVFPGSSKLVFYLLYSLASALVVLLWIACPRFALAGFLVISAYHFGSDLGGESPLWIRACYGLTILTIPCVLYGKDVAVIYQMLAGSTTGYYVMLSRCIAYLAGVITLSAMLLKVKSDPRRAAEFGVILLSGITFPPILFFCCYFGLLHSPRHLVETASALGLKTLRSVLGITAPIVATTLSLAAIAWCFSSRYALQQRVLLIVFVGLAALTVPHMLLEACAERWLSHTATDEVSR